MTIPGDAEQKIEIYLGSLRARLRSMNDESARDIVEELRSHILDKAAASGEVTASGVDAVLAQLGSPIELASEYLTDDLMMRAEVSRSPVRILEGLFRWSSLSLAGFAVLLLSLTGYFLGVSLMLTAVLKLFHPQTAGLWVIPSGPDDVQISLRMGFGGVPPDGHDVLGWWIVPVGQVLGCGLIVLTTRFALWCVKQYRRAHLFPRG